MAGLNSTDPLAEAIHGTNPQNLVEKITRLKIYNSQYWKRECFGLTAELLVDKAVGLKYIGGTYAGNNKPTAFLCLLLKMLQLQPEKEIVLEYIHNDEFKYLRALGAFYLRLIGKADEIYPTLEPLLNDYRKLSFRGVKGFDITHMDSFIDSLLNDELVCDISLPHLTKRHKLEELGNLQPRKSILEEEFMEQSFTESLNAMMSEAAKEAEVRVPSIPSPPAAADVSSSKPIPCEEGEEAIREPHRDSVEGGRRLSPPYEDYRRRESRGRSRDRFDRDERRRSRSRSFDDDRYRRRRSRSRSEERYRRRRSRSRSEDRYHYRRSRSRSRERPRESSREEDARSRGTAPLQQPLTTRPKELTNTKKFDKMFGSKGSSKEDSRAATAPDKVVDAPEGSVEYWNQMREKLGMKKLKE